MLYLDHNATTTVLSEVRDAMMEVLGYPSNPSSVHAFGRRAKVAMEEARNNVAKMVGVDLRRDGYNLIFTGSGTEANNLVMSSFNRSAWGGCKSPELFEEPHPKVIVSAIEHPSILRHRDYNDNIDILAVNKNGIVRLELLERWLKQNQGGLVSVMMANNETGVIQPIKEIAKLVHEHGALLHSDCVQAVGKIDTDLIDLDVDFISISGHKFSAPAGVGAVIYKERYNLMPMIIGGGQERGARSGTENLAAIVGMGVASSSATLRNDSRLRDLFESRITELCKDSVIFGREVVRLPNTSMISMPNVPANQQLIAFDMEGIAVSSGSACSSGKVKASHVLKAMGVADKLADCAIRVSFGADNTEGDVDRMVEAWIKIWKKQ